MNDAATLEARAARIDLLGQPLVSRLDAQSGAERVALLGDWSALFRLLSGEAQLVAGELRIAGVTVPEGVVQGVVGLMQQSPLLPAAWSAEQFLASSAELSGVSKKAAPKLAFQTLERLGLSQLGSSRLGHLPSAERRALLIAHASLTEPRVLCLEQPLSGLDSHGQQTLLAVIDRASVGRRLLVALGEPEQNAGTRQLLETCGDRLRIAAGVALPEAPSSARATRVTATVCRNHHAFAAALGARGLAAHPTHEAGVLSALTSPLAGPCWRYLVELPGGSTAPVLDAALESEAGLVELRPLPSA